MRLAQATFILLGAFGLQAQPVQAFDVGAWVDRCLAYVDDSIQQEEPPAGKPYFYEIRCISAPSEICAFVSDTEACFRAYLVKLRGLNAEISSELPDQVEGEGVQTELLNSQLARVKEHESVTSQELVRRCEQVGTARYKDEAARTGAPDQSDRLCFVEHATFGLVGARIAQRMLLKWERP